MDQTWLLIHTDNDIRLGMIIPRVGPVRVVLVLVRTFEIEQGLALAAQLVGPLASFDAVVIEQAFGVARLHLWHSPFALVIMDGTGRMFMDREHAKLPWASLARYRPGYGVVQLVGICDISIESLPNTDQVIISRWRMGYRGRVLTGLLVAAVDVPAVGAMLIDGALGTIGQPVGACLLGEGTVGAHVVAVAMVCVRVREYPQMRTAVT